MLWLTHIRGEFGAVAVGVSEATPGTPRWPFTPSFPPAEVPPMTARAIEECVVWRIVWICPLAGVEAPESPA